MQATKKLTELARLSLAEPGSSYWLELTDMLSVQTTTVKEASEKLKVAWGDDDNPSYRSKIARLAHPKDPAAFQAARDADVGIENLLKIARGNATFKNGELVNMTRGKQGGWNRLSPQDRLSKKLQTAVDEARRGHIRKEAIIRIFNQAISGAFNGD